MSDLRDLYQEVVIDHGRRPRNFRVLTPVTHHAEGFNPLCGDRLSLSLNIVDGVIQEAGFQGSGCAISTASASLMTEHLKGKTPAQAKRVFEQFHSLMTNEGKAGDGLLGKLTVLSGVKEYPTRVKCATLAWHTLQAALEQKAQPVSTE
jgi:nitrogen fixation protein NifU and related proteins